MTTILKRIGTLALAATLLSGVAAASINDFTTPDSYDIEVSDSKYKEPLEGLYIEVSSFDLSKLTSCSTGWDMLNVLYPSGMRIPTICVTAFDYLQDQELIPILRDDVAACLVELSGINGEKRYDFTSAEYGAVAAYYNLMQLKSVSLGLPAYYAETQTKVELEVTQEEAKTMIDTFESKYGAILFPSGAWSEEVEETYDIELDDLLMKSNQTSFCIPSTVTIINTAIAAYDDLKLAYSPEYEYGGEGADTSSVSTYGLSTIWDFLSQEKDPVEMCSAYAVHFNKLDLETWGLTTLRVQSAQDIQNTNERIRDSIKTATSSQTGIEEPESPAIDENYFSGATDSDQQNIISADREVSNKDTEVVTTLQKPITLRYVFSIFCLVFIVFVLVVYLIRDWFRKRKDPYYWISRRL